MPETPSSPRFVFVYGTLRQGEANDITRLRPAPQFVGTAQVHGRLYDLGRYPGLVLDAEAGPVLGEVYAITPALELKLDEIEELYPQQSNEYAKRELPVPVAGHTRTCLVYEINPSHVEGRPLIKSGDWVQREGRY